MKIKPININGTDYYTIEQFAVLTDKKAKSIEHLALYGRNNQGIIKTKKINGVRYVYATELKDYLWSEPGAGAKNRYYFNDNGDRIYVKQKNDD